MVMFPKRLNTSAWTLMMDRDVSAMHMCSRCNMDAIECAIMLKYGIDILEPNMVLYHTRRFV